MLLIDTGLQSRGIKNFKGAALEVLFTMVTDDGTKQMISSQRIVDALPKNRTLTKEDIEYCIEEFVKIKLLRRLSDN